MSALTSRTSFTEKDRCVGVCIAQRFYAIHNERHFVQRRNMQAKTRYDCLKDLLWPSDLGIELWLCSTPIKLAILSLRVFLRTMSTWKLYALHLYGALRQTMCCDLLVNRYALSLAVALYAHVHLLPLFSKLLRPSINLRYERHDTYRLIALARHYTLTLHVSVESADDRCANGFITAISYASSSTTNFDGVIRHARACQRNTTK